MNLTINSKQLFKALSVAARAAEKRGAIPILSHVLFRADAGRVSVSGTNLNLEITSVVDADVSDMGSACVPALTFVDIAKKLPDSDKVKISAEDGRLTIRAGRSRFNMAVLPASDWPEIVRKDASHRFAISAERLGDMFAKTSFASSSEETRFYLRGVYLHPVDGMLRAVATDGHKLSALDLPSIDAPEGMPGVIIPRETVNEVVKVFSADAKVEIGVSENFIVFDDGRTVVSSKLIDANYPDYQRVIPQAGKNIATVPADDILAAVSRVSAVSSERGRAVKFTFKPDAIQLSVRDADIGDAEDSVDAEYKGEAMEVGFNHAYMRECIEALGSTDVRFEMNDAGSPCLITGDSDKSHRVVVMPMRV